MILEIKNLSKSFIDGKKTLNVLKNINLSIDQGSIITIKGPSGSGKSTLLSLIGTLDKPNKGEVIFDNENIDSIKDLNRFRNDKIGYIFQFHNLISELSLKENVILPREISRKKVDHQEIKDLFKFFELDDRMHSYPNDLSGGEKQRVSVMRAIINQPSIVIADEPTGNLDQKNVFKMIDLFKKLNNEHNLTFIIATHDNEVFSIGDIKLQLKEGHLKNI
tara:strand:+ start:830 stop:1489 length:660 start_codon:yes stop_codon:yes gene_type:complete